jgi:hypothetical protein
VRRLLAALLVSVSALALAGCGTDDGTVAEDPVSSEATSPSGSPSAEPTEEPTAQPTVGTYPYFEPETYTFRLMVSCYCLGAGAPIKVVVEDGVVVRATYLAADSGRSGVEKGDPADKIYWLTINDIIDAANDTTAARVDVVWPAGQDYPTSVYVDKNLNMADEEIGYTVSNVRWHAAG